MRAKVSIVECQSYEQPQVEAAVHKSLELIGGIQSFIKPKDKVLIKVNALQAREPDDCVTTHPAVVAAVVKEVKQAGAVPLVGDSPGSISANVHQTMETTGIKKATEAAGGRIVYFQETGIVDVPAPGRDPRIRTLKIARAVMEADAIINLPKLKTHNLTLFTGAIKNLFGVITGFHKSRFHIISPRPQDFSGSLVDILEITRPRLNIMDGVYGMEGHGPAGGEKRLMGAIFASADAVALDAVCSAAIGYEPFEIESTRIAHERGLGQGRLQEIEVLGVPLSGIAKRDWKPVRAAGVHNLAKHLPKWTSRLEGLFFRLIRIDPVIMQERCTKCRICLENCPAHTIHEKNGRIEIDHSKCIMCFCCHELCPYRAIRLEKTWLMKALRIIKDG